MLRIAYEIAKKIDPECWVSVSTLSHYEFLDALMRYTDNPNNGEINATYPDYGGAYFDCIGFIQYPKGEIIDIEKNITYNKFGSDSLVLKVIISKKNFENITNKYGFGIKYPKKIFINDETGLTSEDSCKLLGGEEMRINWILKLSLLSLEYDIKQNHNKNLLNSDECEYGDYFPIIYGGGLEDSFKNLKSSSAIRKTLRKITLEKYVFEANKTSILKQNLPENMVGIVLKRQFPRESDDEYDYNYIYSLWIFCEDKEVKDVIEYQLNIPFNPLMIDYRGKEYNYTNSSKILISSTPIFLLGNIENEESEKEKRKKEEEKKENEENEEENKKDKKNEEESSNNILTFIIIFCPLIIVVLLLLLVLCCRFKRKQNNEYNNVDNYINQIDLLDKYLD